MSFRFKIHKIFADSQMHSARMTMRQRKVSFSTDRVLAFTLLLMIFGVGAAIGYWVGTCVLTWVL